MKDLNYQPNLLASSLRKKKTGTIGLVIPDSSNLLFADLSKNLEDIFSAKKYNIIVSNSAYDIKREIGSLATLISKRVDGVLIVPAASEGEHIKKIKESGIPIIILDRKMQGLNIDTVLVDNYKGCKDATNFLINMGHREIGYIDRIEDHSHSLERKKGFMDALKEKGIRIDDENITRGGFTFQDGANSAKVLVEKNPKISALFSFNDMNALGAIRGLADLGLKVPDDISVTGNDDIAISSIFIPRLTTVHYPIKEIALEASRLLLKRMKEPVFTKAREIIISPELIVRESVSRYAGRV